MNIWCKYCDSFDNDEKENLKSKKEKLLEKGEKEKENAGKLSPQKKRRRKPKGKGTEKGKGGYSSIDYERKVSREKERACG